MLDENNELLGKTEFFSTRFHPMHNQANPVNPTNQDYDEGSDQRMGKRITDRRRLYHEDLKKSRSQLPFSLEVVPIL
jgi:hypothetical protein